MVLELEFLRRKVARMDAHVEDYAARARADAEAECAEKVARLEKALAGQKSATEALRQEMNNEMLQGMDCHSSIVERLISHVLVATSNELLSSLSSLL